MNMLDVGVGFVLGLLFASFWWVCLIGLIKQRLGIGGKR